MKQEVQLQSTKGLHASLASKIVQLTHQFDATIQIHYADQVVDAKSILGLISLAIPYGENLRIVAEGNQAKDALQALRKLLG